MKIMTPAEIAARNLAPVTKKNYLNRYNKAMRMKSIIQMKRERAQFIRDNAHLPIQELADKLDITKRALSNIAQKNSIVLLGSGRPKVIARRIAKTEAEKAAKKTKPVKLKKEPARQGVKKDKIIQQEAGKVAKKKEKALVPVVRDFTAMKLVHLGIKNISFYVPADATQKQIEQEKEKRMLKYQLA